MKRNFITACVLLTTGICLGQNYQKEDFAEIPLPKEYSEELRALNYAKHEFNVQLIKGNLIITKAKYERNSTYNVTTGKLIGTNAGEWGGRVFYQPKNERQKIIFINGKPDTANTKLIKSKVIYYGTPLNQLEKNTHLVAQANVVGLFSVDSTICYLEGLAHLSYNAGALSKISINQSEIKTERLMDFNSAPFAYAIFNGKIYIAAFDNFYTVTNWKKEQPFDNVFWRGLYPNSIAIKDESHVYIGMRGGYALLNLKNIIMKFYKYNK